VFVLVFDSSHVYQSIAAACSGCRYLSCFPTKANNHCQGYVFSTSCISFHVADLIHSELVCGVQGVVLYSLITSNCRLDVYFNRQLDCHLALSTVATDCGMDT
jgi:hypothetical protein